jgi:hypothetical protein
MRRRPPPFNEIYSSYLAEDPEMKLRAGQWFYNQFLAGMEGPNIDLLYDTTDFDLIFSILEEMYKNYQWPMAKEL